MGFKCIYFCMSLFFTWAEVTQGRVQGRLQLFTGSESGLGQVLDGFGATMASFSSLVWGQAAPRSAGIRSEQGQAYCGLKEAKKLLDKTPAGAGPRVGGRECVCVTAPACFCGLSCSSSLDPAPTPHRQDKVK